jgi:hypothetical protein
MFTTRPAGAFILLGALASAACDKPAVEPTTSGRPEGGAGAGAGGGGPGSPADAGGGGSAGTSDGRSPAPPAPFPDGGGAAAEAAGPPATCAEDVQLAQQGPVDLLLVLDRSGSMIGEKWIKSRAAWEAFARDPKSSGLGLGLQFFPVQPNGGRCTREVECMGEWPVPTHHCTTRLGCVATAGLDPQRPPILCGGDFDDPCPAGTSCVPVGICSASGLDCLTPGQPCPSNMSGDLCMRPDTACRMNFINPSSCDARDYQRPTVPIQNLPGGALPLLATFARLEPFGHTPLQPAVTGALVEMRRHLAANPGRRGVLIVATDGLPTECKNDDPQPVAPIAALLADAFRSPPNIRTYVIGVFDTVKDGPAGAMAVNTLAAAGGTGMAFVLAPTANLTDTLLAALSQIRGAALPCEFIIPPPRTGSIDYGKVNVRLRGAGGMEDIPFVGTAARCDPTRGGWYYDVDPARGAPTRVLMCPATCARFKAETSASVQVAYGCKTVVIE